MTSYLFTRGLLRWLSGATGDGKLIPELRRSPGEGNGNPLLHLGNPMDRGAWQVTVHGVAKSRTRLNQLSLSYHKQLLEQDSASVLQLIKNLPLIWETWVWSLGWEDSLEKGIPTPVFFPGKSHGQESGGLQSMGSWLSDWTHTIFTARILRCH